MDRFDRGFMWIFTTPKGITLLFFIVFVLPLVWLIYMNAIHPCIRYAEEEKTGTSTSFVCIAYDNGVCTVQMPITNTYKYHDCLERK